MITIMRFSENNVVLCPKYLDIYEFLGVRGMYIFHLFFVYRDNSAEIGDNSAEIGNGAAGIVDIAANVIPC